jgi:hypothetical protein
MVALLGACLAVVACGDDDETNPTSSSTSVTTGGGGGNGGAGGSGGGDVTPAVPDLGTVIDRMGRPAINTAVNVTFDPPNHPAAADAWNNNDDPSTWAASFADTIAADIAIYDALDGVCGNQLLNCGDNTMANCYAGLAGALANDWLLVKGDATEGCNQYLAVEANAVGAIANDQCGGRTPAYDVIETTYSVLAVGGVTGVDDTITAPFQV